MKENLRREVWSASAVLYTDYVRLHIWLRKIPKRGERERETFNQRDCHAMSGSHLREALWPWPGLTDLNGCVYGCLYYQRERERETFNQRDYRAMSSSHSHSQSALAKVYFHNIQSTTEYMMIDDRWMDGWIDRWMTEGVRSFVRYIISYLSRILPLIDEIGFDQIPPFFHVSRL